MRVTVFMIAVTATLAAVEPLAPKTFTRLPLGSVEPQGWLLDQLVRQANSLAGYMSKSTFPGADAVNKSVWVGGDGSVQGGSLQWLPYWTNGQVPLVALIRAANATDRLDAELDLAITVDQYMEYVLDHRNTTTGWIGPEWNEPGDVNGHGLWDPLNMLRSLMMWAEDHKHQESRVVQAVVAHLTEAAELLKTDTVHKWSMTRWPTFVQICQHVEDLYLAEYGADTSIMPLGKEGTREVLRNASSLFMQKGMDWAGYYHQTAEQKFPEVDVQAWNVYDHGVNNAEGALNWPAVAYRMSADPADAQELNTVLEMIDTYQGTINALLSADEVFAGRAPHRGTETCAVVEAMASLEHSFTVLGNVSLMDRIERLAFNAMPAALTGDMWANVYVQQANSVFAGKTSPTPWPEEERGSSRCGRDVPEDLVDEEQESVCQRIGDIPSKEDENSNFFGVSHFPCCITNFPQGWPKFAMHAIVVEESDEPAAVIASLVPAAATLPASVGGGARIVTDTQYPFSDTVTIRVTSSGPMRVKVRIPGWADHATIDGKHVQNGTFAVVQCGEGETIVKLELNPEIRLEFGWGERGVAAGAVVNYSDQGSAVPTNPSDLWLEDGASVIWGKKDQWYLNSGGKGQTSTATLLHPLAGKGHHLTGFSMTYSYMALFQCEPGDCKDPPHIEVVAADAASGQVLSTLYTSPDLDKHSPKSGYYSPPQHVSVDNLRIPNSKPLLLKLQMVNGGHAVQFAFGPTGGFNVSVQWSAEVGPGSPSPTVPWLQPPTNGLGITRGPLIFALHPNESRKVVKSYDNPPLRPLAVDNEISTDDTWNYGLLPSKGFRFMPMPSQAWNAGFAFDDSGEYPFYVHAVARQVREWGYWQGSMITDVPPPSPVDCTTACGDEIKLRLVPFGSTNIRISVFPWMEAGVRGGIYI